MKRIVLTLAIALAGSTASAQYQPDVESWTITSAPEQQTVVVRDATIWTADEAGILESADLIVEDGRIVAVGTDLRAPREAVEIDGTGMHVTPGIIDAHSHAAITGGVNEATDISTAQVRIEDVIDAESINIYRQLAGGVTDDQPAARLGQRDRRPDGRDQDALGCVSGRS
jgi:imidazolonepropionase-like amidohydrolase